jgi:uncharacterized protein YdeI (YjbR/CyaY-like superfamily)
MIITKTLYVKNRDQWRAWLQKHHATKREIWLIYYKKDSGRQRIPYNDAVEEALCFGWIDSTLKAIDKEKFAQRFSPRNPRSVWSAMNKERVRRLFKQRKMTPAGLAKLDPHFRSSLKTSKGKAKEKLFIPPDILEALKQDKKVWKNFRKFPESYKRIRIGWVDASRHRREFFKKRLQYFLKMTAQNKRYGMVQ